ncbi:diguanylate cyclase [Defluviitalea phaphyphila]|uniref:diguanylate cyclase n=1 Tax=Defluviitalea phaphyphila TaxID=1473580 RepID=UPI000730D81C|nr:diguanylate cyclase [Defluviitalea phaphyphila]
MIEDLFINASIIIAFIAILNQVFLKENRINKNSSLILQIIFAILNSILGIILMLYSVNVIQDVIIDFRGVAITLSALFGGFISAIITSIIIGIFRIIYFGATNPSIVAFIDMIIVGILFPIIINKTKTLRNKWLNTALLYNIIVTISWAILIPEYHYLIEMNIIFWIMNFIVSFILYRYIEYIIASNELLAKYRLESTKDFLTGLNNVRKFDEVFNSICNRVIKNKEQLSLLFIDIDFFKKVNDTYGHAVGDMVLKELGKILVKNCRDFDIVSRNGGEEFSVMLINCSSKKAVDIAERIRIAVKNHSFITSIGKSINITVSIGVANYPETIKDINEIKEKADSALYRAKRTGRDKVVLYDNECINCVE